MKKTHWFRKTLITVVACGLAGLILAVILFNANPGRTGAFSSVEFRFSGAAEGVAPNGVRYDLGLLTSDEVLSAALEEAGLSGRYTPDDISGSLLVTGLYPENIVEQMTGYQSVLTGDVGRVSFTDYHATSYSVALYNEFDKNISREDLEKLLAAVLSQFRARFERQYSVFLTEDALLGDLAQYDYLQQLEILENAAARRQGFAEEMARKHPGFRVDGKGFGDIAVRYGSLITSDLERIRGLVTANALSINPDRVEAQYAGRVTRLEIRVAALQQEAADTESLIALYSKDDILYVSTTEALQKVGGSTENVYDALVARSREIADSVSEATAELNAARQSLEDLRGGKAAPETAAPEADAEDAGAAETEETAPAEPAPAETDREAVEAVVKKGIETALSRLNAVTDDFSAFLQAYSAREMNEDTIAVAPVAYDTPKLISVAFIKTALKTAGPLCLIGFMICIFCMIVSRVKEDKKQKK